jgi:uncharacterized protein (TIGR03000 family)
MSLFTTARLTGLAAFVFGFAFLLGPTAPQVVGQAKEEKKDGKTDAKKVKTKLKVTVPLEDAELEIEGKMTKLPGVVREFETPELDAGKKYEYTFKVVWRPNNYTTITRSRENIVFTAGEDLNVDLTNKDDKQPDKVVIRWVPTPDDIVLKMIELAGVKKDDIVMEPGPGDGRVLIAAVKAGAKKAVGIELDKEKATEAKEKVKEAGLLDKIEIKEGDALAFNGYGDANVIFLYMGDEFDAALRPNLEKSLKPGSRIVSHRFKIGDWAPDKSLKIRGEDGDEYEIHLWTVKEKK